MINVIKLDLNPIGQENWGKFWSWNSICYRLLNRGIAYMHLVRSVSHLGNDQITVTDKEVAELTRIGRVLKKENIRIAENGNGKNSFAYPLPSAVIDEMQGLIKSNWSKTEYKEILSGLRSVRTYKRNAAIPIKAKGIKFKEKDGNVVVAFAGSTKFKYSGPEAFIYFGKRNEQNREIVKKIISGELEHKGSKIKINGKKIMLYLSVEFPEKKYMGDKDIIAGVDLGINVPAVVALNSSPAREFIGNREEFLTSRRAIFAQKRKLQKALRFTNGGKGRTKKLKALEKIRQKESNFAKNKNHVYSRKVIDFCVKNNVGVIHIESGITDTAKKNRYLLRNWSVYQLIEFITYKAKQYGIEVKEVEKAYTSQRCIKCDHISRENREGIKFKCVNCGHEEHADYVGAKNIASINEWEHIQAKKIKERKMPLASPGRGRPEGPKGEVAASAVSTH